MASFRALLVVVLSCVVGALDGFRAWMNSSECPMTRARKLVEHMTLDEKLELFHGSCSGYTGNVCANNRLGIPAIKMNDGPQGFRYKTATSTSWPAAITVAASFDDAVAREWGVAMGDEFYRKGANVQLGPGVCVARVPRNGRNFEYSSGEDPYLGYRMAFGIVSGIQSQGVVANAKHWVNNNQETDRTTVSENVDERTQFELYYPPFEGAIAAGVGSFMCSYNKICQNCPAGQIGNWSCENPDTLQRDLKERLGFKGWVMSDWGATHSASINAGLDQEMPGSSFMNPNSLQDMLHSGALTIEKVDDSAQRILWPLFAVGAFDNKNENSVENNVTSQAHRDVARKLSAKGTVLLKNDGGLLPIAAANHVASRRLAIIGTEATNPIVHGGGSGAVTASYIASPLESVRGRVGLQGTQMCNGGGVCVSYDDGSDLDKAAAVAEAADVAIIFVATTSSEGGDRANLGLGKHDDLITAVAEKAGRKTVVVVVTPGAVLTPWRDSVAAILVPFMPGQEYGDAIVDILFGDVNPGAKLPLTFPAKENEVGLSQKQWPGEQGSAVYSEGLEVGYRWYTSHGVEPAFPFGHGLSYTTFSYSSLEIRTSKSKAVVSCRIKNIGKVAGHEVAQLYLEFPADAGEPRLQLKAFKKVSLEAGASASVELVLDDRSFSIWDIGRHAWSVVRGTFSVHVGASSTDIRLRGSFPVSSNTDDMLVLQV
jgi:beta-glucosidase